MLRRVAGLGSRSEDGSAFLGAPSGGWGGIWGIELCSVVFGYFKRVASFCVPLISVTSRELRRFLGPLYAVAGSPLVSSPHCFSDHCDWGQGERYAKRVLYASQSLLWLKYW